MAVGLTEDLARRLCEEARRGLTLPAAAGGVRVPARYVSRWLQRGREDMDAETPRDTIYARFAEAWDAAEGEAQRTAELKGWDYLGRNSSGLNGYVSFMERRYPEWRRRDKVAVEGQVTHQIVVTRWRDGLEPAVEGVAVEEAGRPELPPAA